ncbi:uncharacterized protein A4U43_C02F14740 [Asparagus officinalis]|uniref:Uncharacterized protein n=1 Tax=Asparagus officinalis TaxID=4686 RepID=A0A5P1FII0_ASPOF|nr:uncharacterized protein A4U43_C02F14740 [Asparagus officinalis]
MTGSSCTCPRGDKGLKEDLNHSYHDISLTKEKIEYLQSKVLAVSKEKDDAFERVHVARLDSKEPKARIVEKDEEADGGSNNDVGESSDNEAI